MNVRNALLVGLLTATVAVTVPSDLSAHPHVLIDAKSEIVFDVDGRMTSIRQIWQFDPAFTAYAVQGLDENGDGELSDAELEPLAKVNVESLKEFDFFTYLTIGDKDIDFVEPDEYWLEFYDGRLTLFYNLPLKKPVAVGPDTTLEVFDPDYFVAFHFVDKDPITLVNAPPNCTAIYHPPGHIDAQTMAMLNAVPQDQRQLPPELAGAADKLADFAEIKCS